MHPRAWELEGQEAAHGRRVPEPGRVAVAAAVKTSAVTTDPGEETAQRTSDPSCHGRHETAAAVADASSAADMAGRRRIERAPVKAAATMTVVHLEVLGRCWTGGDGRTAAVAVRNGAVDVPALLRHLFASTVFQPV